MSVLDNLKASGRRVKYGLAAIPGFPVLLQNIHVPPGISHITIGALAEITACFSMFYFNKTKHRSSDKMSSLFFLFGFFALFVLYYYLYKEQVDFNSLHQTEFLIPFQKSDDLKKMITEYGSFDSAVDNFGPQQIRDIEKKDVFNFFITRAVFAILYVASLESLTLSIIFVLRKQKGAKNISHQT